MKNINNKSLVITSINPVNEILQCIAKKAKEHSYSLIIVGDTKSPRDFFLEHGKYYSIRSQKKIDLMFAQKCPHNTYARKNIGYLLAMQNGADYILETDDDNLPGDKFFTIRPKTVDGPLVSVHDWVNIYEYFTNDICWPRGLPLDKIYNKVSSIKLSKVERLCPIHQGLANKDPDVDAIFRMVFRNDITFTPGKHLILDKYTWSPFNSQNTAWYPEAYPLMYLPVHCSFRMTDIYRSFVAQRIGWENNYFLHISPVSITQYRNKHNLFSDFLMENLGYKTNAELVARLERLNLSAGAERIGDNIKKCYKVFIEMRLVEEKELTLIDAWIEDINYITGN